MAQCDSGRRPASKKRMRYKLPSLPPCRGKSLFKPFSVWRSRAFMETTASNGKPTFAHAALISRSRTEWTGQPTCSTGPLLHQILHPRDGLNAACSIDSSRAFTSGRFETVMRELVRKKLVQHLDNTIRH